MTDVLEECEQSAKAAQPFESRNDLRLFALARWALIHEEGRPHSPPVAIGHSLTILMPGLFRRHAEDEEEVRRVGQYSRDRARMRVSTR
jgi:hypothetical protein